tara:strand:+ start:614 stop:862 length:249 start_codon:yes stop_codon:yes gene_type:complete
MYTIGDGSMEKQVRELIEAARTFCLDNYENGFDEFVECYEDDEWLELATKENGELMTWKELLTEIKRTQKIRADYAAEIRGA